MTEYINSFPTYEFVYSKEDNKYHNIYRGVDVGKGGWVYSDKGIYTNVALLDVASMHPASIIALNKLGKYTKKFADLRQARVYIKHGDYESASKLFDGKLSKYLTSKSEAETLSKALKLPINAFFGIGFANFENPARDSRDVNNIVALRGALFMKTLFDAVEEQGFHIVHVKTDSCKIPNATPEIIKFVQDFAKKYGYEMEHEATYERMCLIDKAQYVATFMSPEECQKRYGYVPGDNEKHFKKNNHPWTITGDAFKNPYLFKTLFSGEPIEFKDMCETKSVKDAAMYLDMNENLPDVTAAEKELEKRRYNDIQMNDPSSDKKPKRLNDQFAGASNEKLEYYISQGHDYRFVGRVGSFYPIRPGANGGILLSLRNGKYSSITGTKGYRWLESAVVKVNHLEDQYDPKYFENMIDEAIKSINVLGSFDRFIDLTRPYEPPDDISPAADDNPPWVIVPCGDGKYASCMDCPNYDGSDRCGLGYSLATYVNEGGEK